MMLRKKREAIEGLKEIDAVGKAYESYEYNGYRIDVFIDEYPSINPRDKNNSDYFGTLAIREHREVSGDKGMNFMSYDALHEHISEMDIAVIHEVYIYNHSGIALSPYRSGWPGEIWPDQRWDVGFLGYIYATKKDIEKEYGSISDEHIEHASRLLLSELRTYDLYCRGQVFGFSIKRIDTNEEIDSCWGFITDDIYNDVVRYAIQGL